MPVETTSTASQAGCVLDVAYCCFRIAAFGNKLNRRSEYAFPASDENRNFLNGSNLLMTLSNRSIILQHQNITGGD